MPLPADVIETPDVVSELPPVPPTLTSMPSSVAAAMVTVLTDAAGRTLYWFAPDTAARSACYGSCAAYWPPVKGPVTAGPGVTGQLSTLTRSDGSIQAAYDGTLGVPLADLAGLIGETLGVERAAITHEVRDGKGTLTIGGVVHSEMHPYTGPDGSPTTGWFRVVRGAAGHGLRAVFAPPASSPFTVSDVKIGGVPVQFGGQIAQMITMKLTGVAGVATAVHNPAQPCVVSVGTAHVAIGHTPAPSPTRGGR